MSRPSILTCLILALLCTDNLSAQGCRVIMPSGPMPESAPNFARLWPGGIIPFQLQPGVNPAGIDNLRKAMDHLEAVCNIRFVPRNGEANYVAIWQQDPSLTYSQSELGYQGDGAQDLRIRFGITGRFGMIHELMHTLGVYHEQQRPDRDNFVTINWNNISQTLCNSGPCDSQFAINAGASPSGPYDYDSIMHYGDHTFSTCREPNSPDCDTTNTTITTLDPAFQDRIGQRWFLSQGDAQGLQGMYGPPQPPVLNSLSTSFLQSFQPSAVISIEGDRIITAGSTNSAAVLRTVVRVGNVVVPTQLSTAGRLICTIPGSLLAQEGTYDVTLENPAPSGGGVSNALQLTIGVTTNQFYGHAVLGIEDINNDGVRDLVVTAPGWNGGRGLVRGVSGANLSEVLWSFEGTSANSFFGGTIADLGDFAGNGSRDIAVGEPGRNNGAGAVTIIRTTGSFVGRIQPNVPGERFGAALAMAGDVNGDGRQDLLVGAPNHLNDSGRVVIVSGQNGAILDSIVGSAGDRMGTSIAGGVDFTGDGAPDFVAGAPTANPNGADSGAVYLFDPQRDVPIFGSLIGVIEGGSSGDRFGTAVGLTDAAEPQIFASGPGIGANGLVTRHDAATSDFLGTIPVPAGSSEFGLQIFTLPDMDDDAVSEIAISAGDGFSGFGSVLLVSGGMPGKRQLFRGSGNDEQFGRGVTTLGDRNGDGYTDLVIGVPEFDQTVQNQGRIAARTAIMAPNPFRPMINEVIVQSGEWGVEITNRSQENWDLEGWSVRLRKASGNTVIDTGALASRTLVPGASILLTGPSTSYTENPWVNFQKIEAFPSSLQTSSSITVGLFAPNGRVVDEVAIDGTNTNHDGFSFGSAFRGSLNRFINAASFERVPGLDTNQASDWTQEFVHSAGLQNRNSGERGARTFDVPQVRINEIVTNPDWIELVNRGQITSLLGWSVHCSADQNQDPVIIYPWMQSEIVGANAFALVGDSGPAPSEMPGGTSWTTLASQGLGNIPFTDGPLELALYDARGQLVDLVRSTGEGDVRVHNHPRAPGPWDAFVGAAPRAAVRGADSIVARQVSNDTDSGSDWRTLTTRSLGLINPIAGFTGPIGHADPLSVRIDATPLGGGLALIMNAGQPYAGMTGRVLFSAGHSHGQGPIFGLGVDALANFENYWVQVAIPLDFRGSGRIDLAPLSLPPGAELDTVFFVLAQDQTPVLNTLVLEYDVFGVPM